MAQKREDAVSKEVTRKLSEADNRKMSRKEKDERCVCAWQMFMVELFGLWWSLWCKPGAFPAPGAAVTVNRARLEHGSTFASLRHQDLVEEE